MMTADKRRPKAGSNQRPVEQEPNPAETGRPNAEDQKPSPKGLAFWVKIAVIAGVVIAGLNYFLPRGGGKAENGVVSHGQQGGTTAQSYNDNSVTSHGQSGGITTRQLNVYQQYFSDQPAAEKEALRQSLMTKYPRGYAVFGLVDGEPTRTIEGLSFEEDFEMIWTGSEIARLGPDYIDFHPPGIIYKPTKNAALGSFNLRLPRKVGYITRYRKLLPSWTNVFLEVLDDKESFAVVVLGFKEADRSTQPATGPD